MKQKVVRKAILSVFKQESGHLGGILDFSQTEFGAGKEAGEKKGKKIQTIKT